MRTIVFGVLGSIEGSIYRFGVSSGSLGFQETRASELRRLLHTDSVS